MDLSGATLEELNDALIQRTAGVDALDRLFRLPEFIENATLREMYEVVVARLRRESSHVAMNTVQQLLMERLAFNYIVLRAREALPLGDPQGFADARSLRDWNTYWLACTKEFNDLLARNRPAATNEMIQRVQAAVAEVLGTVEDGGLRNELIERFVHTFEREGLVRT